MEINSNTDGEYFEVEQRMRPSGLLSTSTEAAAAQATLRESCGTEQIHSDVDKEMILAVNQSPDLVSVHFKPKGGKAKTKALSKLHRHKTAAHSTGRGEEPSATDGTQQEPFPSDAIHTFKRNNHQSLKQKERNGTDLRIENGSSQRKQAVKQNDTNNKYVGFNAVKVADKDRIKNQKKKSSKHANKSS